jgi:lipopolysaccharide/colanic/teichoic acid biosynthesis glycosyltransferase
MLVIALAIAITSGAPVLYRQRRIGYREEPFRMFKFRTMTVDHTGGNEAYASSDRITPLGWWLRRFGLDELPQLINILRGEMSLIGPRPLLDLHLRLMTPAERRRHLVLPGITGWSQVKATGQSEASVRLALDTWYVDNISLWTDAKVVFSTILCMVARPSAVYDRGYQDLDRRMT